MAGDKMCKTREMKTVSTATVHRKRAPANTKVAIQSHKVLPTKVVTARTTTTTTAATPMATIKARTTDKKLQLKLTET